MIRGRSDSGQAGRRGGSGVGGRGIAAIRIEKERESGHSAEKQLAASLAETKFPESFGQGEVNLEVREGERNLLMLWPIPGPSISIAFDSYKLKVLPMLTCPVPYDPLNLGKDGVNFLL